VASLAGLIVGKMALLQHVASEYTLQLHRWSVRVCLRARASVPDGLRRRRRWTLESARSIGRSRPRDPVAFFGHLGDRWLKGRDAFRDEVLTERGTAPPPISSGRGPSPTPRCSSSPSMEHACLTRAFNPEQATVGHREGTPPSA
jgi:hypothetical protein